MFKVNNKNTRTRCERYSELTIKTPERRQRRRYCVFIVNFEHTSHSVFIVSFEQVNTGWDRTWGVHKNYIINVWRGTKNDSFIRIEIYFKINLEVTLLSKNYYLYGAPFLGGDWITGEVNTIMLNHLQSLSAMVL